ncbi:hypothetical protein [Haladaptatus sp. R4]|uniref:hypothetical protein n=1 Tax=Haladaptatus sp. R4 TaxID=1679489 RepID=UPI001CC1248D|nr:hypothetical protein [Haladaptatus sp. R4]
MKIGLLNPTVLVRPDPQLLAPRLAAAGHDVVFYHPEKGRGNPPEGPNITVKYYPARFVPELRYTLPTPGFYRLLKEDIPDAGRTRHRRLSLPGLFGWRASWPSIRRRYHRRREQPRRRQVVLRKLVRGLGGETVHPFGRATDVRGRGSRRRTG